MTHAETLAAIGSTVIVTGQGDLWFEARLHPVITLGNATPRPVLLVRVSKSGMAIVRAPDGQEYAVPPRNLAAPEGTT